MPVRDYSVPLILVSLSEPFVLTWRRAIRDEDVMIATPFAGR